MFWLFILVSFSTRGALPNNVTARQNVPNTARPNITKQWFAYINMFVFIVQKQLADTKVYTNSILYRMKTSELFKLSSQNAEFSSFRNKTVLNVDASICQMYDGNCTIPLKYQQATSAAQKYISKPSGKLTSVHNKFFSCKVTEKYVSLVEVRCRTHLLVREKYNFAWIFHLDPQLSLNLTILRLLIISEKACNTGSLTILNVQNNTTQLRYCEHHASFSVFADFQLVKIKLTMLRCKFYKFNSIFLVYDKRMISSLATLPQSSKDICSKSTQSDNSCQFVFGLLTQWGCTTFVYIIQTDKFHQVVVQISQNHFQLIVFDSPVISKRTLKPIGGEYFCSTFQCLIQLFGCTLQNDIEICFSHKAIPPTLSLTLQTDNIVLSLPIHKCTASACVVHAKAQKRFTTNITVLSLEYNGPKTFLCRFGGFLIPHIFEGVHKQNVMLCKNYFWGYIQNRGYFSHKTSTSILLFWYDTISNIKARLSVSQIHCKLVTHNLCSEEPRPWGTSNYIGVYSVSSRILAVGDGIDRVIDKCLILDLFAVSSDSMIDRRWSRFYLWSKCVGDLIQHRTMAHAVSSVEIKGLSTPNYHLEANATCDYGCYEMYRESHVKINGIFDQFCTTYSPTGECQTETNNSHRKIIVFGNQEEGFQIKAQMSTKRVKQSVSKQSVEGYSDVIFLIFYQIRRNSQSWLQIVVKSVQQKNHIPSTTTAPAQIEVSVSLFHSLRQGKTTTKTFNIFLSACKHENFSPMCGLYAV